MIKGWMGWISSQPFRPDPLPRLPVPELEGEKKRALPAGRALSSDSEFPSCILAQITLLHITFGTLISAVPIYH